MTLLRDSRRTLALALFLLLVGLVASVCELLLSLEAWGARVGLLLGGLAVSISGVAVWMAATWRRQETAQHWLELIDRLLVDDLSLDETALGTPVAAHPWSNLMERVQQGIISAQHRMRNAEHGRAALEVRLRRAQGQYERIQCILNQLAEPVIAIDAYDELMLTNPAAERLLGLPLARTERQPLADVLRFEPLVKLLTETRQRRWAHGRTVELEITSPVGQSGVYSTTVTPIVSPSRPGEGRSPEPGDSLGSMAVLRDVSSQKESHKRHAEFVSSVSHEMKTPLASIKAYVELLVDGDAEDEATRESFLDVINSQADRLQRLIDNLLNLARIEAGVTKVQKRAQSLNEVLQEAVHVLAPAAERKQIELAAELSPLYLGVVADRDMLVQAVINLLSNAIKYTPDGGRVTLRSRQVDEDVCFEVADTGVGLSPEDCARVFDKFYRVKKHSDMAPGTGLGLALVKHIVEDVHRGRIAVESQLGSGSTFRVLLPLAAGRATTPASGTFELAEQRA